MNFIFFRKKLPGAGGERLVAAAAFHSGLYAATCCFGLIIIAVVQ